MKLKKLFAAVISCLTLTSLASCNKESLEGTEAAKILLANERLDAESLQTSGNLFTTGEAAMKRLANEIKKYSKRYAGRDGETYSERKGDTVYWYNDADYSNMGSYFESYSDSIESQAKRGAEMIDYTKKNIKVTEKWVSGTFSTEDYLLHVDGNSETILTRLENQYEFCRRTMNEEGLNVYEMFITNSETKSNVKMKYIPGLVYEFCENSDWGAHYLIADNYKGYWTVMTNTRHYGREEYMDGHFYESFYFLILKDDVKYETGFMFNQFPGDKSSIDDMELELVSSDGKTDLFSYRDGEFTLRTTGLEGIKWLQSTGTFTDDYTNQDADILEADGIYNSITPPEVHLENGEVWYPEKTKFDNVSIGLTRASYVHGCPSYGDIEISIDYKSDDHIKELLEFIGNHGISFRRDHQDVYNDFYYATKEATSVKNYYKWHGYPLNTKEGIIAAFEEDDRQIQEARDLCAKYENAPTISKGSQAAISGDLEFPTLTNATSSLATLDDVTLKVPSLKLEFPQSKLFIEGEKYSVGFGLAKEENGVYLDILPIIQEGEFDLSSQTITLDKEIKLNLPRVDEGKNVLVTYLVTKDGIRVSKPTPIKVEAFDNFEISSKGIKNIYKNENESLVIEASFDSEVYLELEGTYEYAELHKELSSNAFLYGLVEENEIIEVLDGNTWKTLAKNESISNGTFRMKYLNNDQEAYVYATIK